jgi:two-component system, response regulator PdtaR
MAARAISEDAAYQMIRREAMQKRQSMAVIASSIIAANSVFERFAGPAGGSLQEHG